MREVNRKMAHGLFWMSLLRFSIRALGLLSTVILARLLVPEDFGLVALATSFIALLELATAFRFDIALIQNQQADRTHFDTAWTINVLFYCGLTVVLILSANPAAIFFDEERLPAVIYALAAGFLARGFENIGIVYYAKELSFRQDFIVRIVRKVAGFIVVIPLAFYLRTYWALVAGMVFGNILSVISTYVLHPYRPRFSLAAAREMFGFSKWLVLNSGIGFLRLRSPNFVIGKLQGSSALGLFNVAYEIATLPTTELIAPINRVVFPAYSKLAKDRDELKKSYLDVLALVATLTLPAGLGLSAVAAPIVDLFLGDKWAEAAPLVAALAIFSAIQTVQGNSGALFNALGKPYLNTALGAVNVPILLTASITLALMYGPIGVAAAFVGAIILQLPLNFYFVCRVTVLRASDVLNVLWRPVCASSFMYLSVLYIGSVIPEMNSVTELTILVTSGAMLYVASTLALWFASGRPICAEYRLALVVARKIKPWLRRAPQES